jgi:hypothetical protein
MVLTGQKPTQRARYGERSEGLPGSTKSVGCVERNARNLGGPGGSWAQAGERNADAGETDDVPQKGKPRNRGRPDPKRKRTLTRKENQVGYPARKGEGMPKAARESDQPIVL